MITKQQNQEFRKHVGTYVHGMSKKQISLGVSVAMFLVIMLFGGMFFWGSALAYNTGRQNDQSELGLARNGLQTIKRMVGNQIAWSESIQEEYKRLFPAQVINTQGTVSSSDNNFIQADPSTDQTVAN